MTTATILTRNGNTWAMVNTAMPKIVNHPDRIAAAINQHLVAAYDAETDYAVIVARKALASADSAVLDLTAQLAEEKDKAKKQELQEALQAAQDKQAACKTALESAQAVRNAFLAAKQAAKLPAADPNLTAAEKAVAEYFAKSYTCVTGYTETDGGDITLDRKGIPYDDTILKAIQVYGKKYPVEGTWGAARKADFLAIKELVRQCGSAFDNDGTGDLVKWTYDPKSADVTALIRAGSTCKKMTKGKVSAARVSKWAFIPKLLAAVFDEEPAQIEKAKKR